jgi:ribonucleoside-diphosphate reductase alpha chain
MTPKRHRPKTVRGETLEMPSPCGKIYVTMNDNPETGDLMEVFVRFGKSGTCGSLVANALTIITSYGLRSGMEVGDAIKGLIGHGCHRAPVVDGDDRISSCVDAIGKAIRLHAQLQEEADEMKLNR